MYPRQIRWIASGLAAMVFGTGLVLPIKARASEEGRRNTTIGLGALSVYLFARKGDKLPAFASAAGTVYAYKRYDDAIKARHKRQSYARQQRQRYARQRQQTRYAQQRTSRASYNANRRQSNSKSKSSSYQSAYQAGYQAGYRAAAYQEGYKAGLAAYAARQNVMSRPVVATSTGPYGWP
jgi:hypothetical protein